MKTGAFVLALFVICVCAACSHEAVENEPPAANVNSNAASPALPVTANETPVPPAFPDEADNADSNEFSGTTSATKKAGNRGVGTVVLHAIRVAAHPNFDRMVFEFSGASLPGFQIEYLNQPARSCGSGEVVRIAEKATLEIRFDSAAAHTEAGESTIGSREVLPNLPVVKELKSTCDFEGDVTWVAGISEVNKYRVLELRNPTRLVVDIKH
jgi:hypothetical protein